MTRYTEELLKISKNFFSLRDESFLEKILEVPANYSMFCLFKGYDEERLYGLTRNSMKNLSREDISAKTKSDNEKFLAIVLGAFEARYEELQNESNLI